MAPLVLDRSTQEQLANAYAEAQGPFSVAAPDGQPDFIVMRSTDFEEYCKPPLTDEEVEALKQGYAEAMRGELRNAREMLAEIRSTGFGRHREPALTLEQRQMIREDYESALRGEVVDAATTVARIRAKYDL